MKKFALIAVLALIATPVLAADAVKHVDPAYMWDLSDLYASPDAWTAARDKTLTNAGKLESYKGTLGKSAADMLEALGAISDAHKEVDRLFVYASLKGGRGCAHCAQSGASATGPSAGHHTRRKNFLADAGNPGDRCRQGESLRGGVP